MRRLRKWPWVLALVGYMVVAGVLMGPRVRPNHTIVATDVINAVQPFASHATHPTYNSMPSDSPFQFFPWVKFLDGELDRGHVPQWNPLILGGVPAMPNGFVSPYYPGFWLLRFFNAFDAYDLYVIAHLVLGAIGCYAFGRRLGARPLPAWIAGNLAFAALMWIHWSLDLVHLAGMVWLPLVLAAANYAVVRGSPRAAAGLAAAFGLWWLGANPQYAYYGTLVLGAYIVGLIVIRRVQSGASLLRPTIAVGSGLAFGALLAAPVLWPTATVVSDIVRHHEGLAAVATSHLPHNDIVLTAVPLARGSTIDHHIYRPYPYGLALDTPFVGVTTIVLAAAALRRRAAEHWLLFALIGGVLLLGFTEWPHHILYGRLPGYDLFRASSRWLSVLPGLAIPLAAVGLDRLASLTKRDRVLPFAAAGGVLLIVAVVVGKAMADSAAPHRFFAVLGLVAVVPVALAVSAVLAAPRRRAVAFALVGVAIAVESAYYLPRWYPSLKETDSYPALAVTRISAQRGGRIVRVGQPSQIPPFSGNIPMAYGIADAQGLAVMFPRQMDHYLRLIDDYGDFVFVGSTAPPILDPAHLASPLLDALDVRTIISDRDPSDPALAGYTLLDAGPPAVYARGGLGPAVVVAHAAPATVGAMWKAVADPAWKPADSAAVVGLAHGIDGGPGKAKLAVDTSDHQRFSVDAPAGGFLRVSGEWNRGWKAKIDGRSVPVRRADGIFRGVELPQGRHTVDFRFANPDESKGRRVAPVALVAILAALAVDLRNRESRE